jgi:hypothetical protein
MLHFRMPVSEGVTLMADSPCPLRLGFLTHPVLAGAWVSSKGCSAQLLPQQRLCTPAVTQWAVSVCKIREMTPQSKWNPKGVHFLPQAEHGGLLNFPGRPNRTDDGTGYCGLTWVVNPPRLNVLISYGHPL